MDLKIDPEVAQAFAEDLDTPRAMLRLRSIEKDQTIGNQDKRAIFLFADQVLGLNLDYLPEAAPITEEIQLLLDQRVEARSSKNWAQSDALRDHLAGLGIEISDGAAGQSWRWK
jgi:cysteinyl-tRNA synthetase